MGNSVVTKRDLGTDASDYSFFATNIYQFDSDLDTLLPKKEMELFMDVEVTLFNGETLTGKNFSSNTESEYAIAYERINSMRNDLGVLLDEMTERYMNYKIITLGEDTDEAEAFPEGE